MNLVRVSLMLMVVSVIYFLAFLYQSSNDRIEIEYLFFCLAFQIIAGQMQITLIMTYVSKINPPDMIPQQICYLNQSQFLGKICTFLFLLPYYYKDEPQIRYTQFASFNITMGVFFLLLFISICYSDQAFQQLKKLGIQQYSYLRVMDPEEYESLLGTLKKTLSSSTSVVAIIGALLIACSRTWLDQQYNFILINFSATEQQQDQQVQAYNGLFGSLLPYLSGIIFLFFLVNRKTFISQKLWFLNMIASFQLQLVSMVAIIGFSGQAQKTIRNVMYGITTVLFQLCMAASFVTVQSIIGQRTDLIKIQGFIFGTFSTFLNLCELWIIAVWFFQTQKQSLKQIQEEKIAIIFFFCFTITALILSRLLIFTKEQLNSNLKPQYQPMQKRSQDLTNTQNKQTKKRNSLNDKHELYID